MSAKVWGVKALTVDVIRNLDRFYPRVNVEGEVAQIQTPRSGHCYFTLKEGDATLGGIVWRREWQAMRYRPKAGDRVRCRGKLSLFAGQSKLQLYANLIEPAGEGWYAKALRERTERLRAEGLLDPARKRPLPPVPRVVGLATSADGAAIADFLRVSRQRFPAAKIVVAACKVQGADAPASVVRALELLVEHGKSDVIVITRGGGSKEDLLAFMDEGLARAIASCPIPVVSAVGHEIDTTLSDLVADAVAATPSAAANIALPDGSGLARRVRWQEQQRDRAWARLLQQHRQRVDLLAGRLKHPTERLARDRTRLENLDRRLTAAMQTGVTRSTHRLQDLRGRLAALSPMAVLERGYAMARTAEGSVITKVGDAPIGQRLRVTLSDGDVWVDVIAP